MNFKFPNIAKLWPVLILLASGGCGSIGQVQNAATMGTNDAYFIIGVQPEFTRISVDEGGIVDGKFQGSLATRLFGGNLVFMGEPEDGFVLGKARGGALLGITMAQPHSSKTALLGPLLTPCESKRGYAHRDGSKTLVFTADAGKVSYIANVRYMWVKDGMVPTYNADLEGARAFLKVHYPLLADSLVQGHYDEIVAGLCVWS